MPRPAWRRSHLNPCICAQALVSAPPSTKSVPELMSFHFIFRWKRRQWISEKLEWTSQTNDINQCLFCSRNEMIWVPTLFCWDSLQNQRHIFHQKLTSYYWCIPGSYLQMHWQYSHRPAVWILKGAHDCMNSSKQYNLMFRMDGKHDAKVLFT